MRREQPPGQGLARLFRQCLHHMRVVQPVKAVAAVALVEIGAGQREARGKLRLRGMKSGIEARDVRYVGRNAAHLAQHAQAERQMQRRQRPQPLQILLDCVVDPDRHHVARPAMHDAMADAAESLQGVAMAFQPFRRHQKSLGWRRDLRCFRDRLPVHFKPRLAADARHLSLDAQCQPRAENCKFERRGAGVEHEDVCHGSVLDHPPRECTLGLVVLRQGRARPR